MLLIIMYIIIIIIKQGKQNEVFQLSSSCTILDTVILLVLIANVCCSWPWRGDYHILLAHQDCQCKLGNINCVGKNITVLKCEFVTHHFTDGLIDEYIMINQCRVFLPWEIQWQNFVKKYEFWNMVSNIMSVQIQ